MSGRLEGKVVIVTGGAEHMIMGSDYPHVIGDIDEAVTSFEELGIPAADKRKIFSENLLGLMR